MSAAQVEEEQYSLRLSTLQDRIAKKGRFVLLWGKLNHRSLDMVYDFYCADAYLSSFIIIIEDS